MANVSMMTVFLCILISSSISVQLTAACWGSCDHCSHCRRKPYVGTAELVRDIQRPMNEPCKFERYDLDGDQTITKDEFDRTISQFQFVKEHVVTMFEVMDANENRMVTRDEFNTAIPILLAARAIDRC